LWEFNFIRANPIKPEQNITNKIKKGIITLKIKDIPSKVPNKPPIATM
jgi:hypothetical protein